MRDFICSHCLFNMMKMISFAFVVLFHHLLEVMGFLVGGRVSQSHNEGLKELFLRF